MELEMEARGGGNHDHRSQGDGNVRGQAEPGRISRRPGKARVLTEADWTWNSRWKRAGAETTTIAARATATSVVKSNLAGVPGGPARLEC